MLKESKNLCLVKDLVSGIEIVCSFDLNVPRKDVIETISSVISDNENYTDEECNEFAESIANGGLEQQPTEYYLIEISHYSI